LVKTNLSIGVRELVEFVLRSGDLAVEFGGTSRAADAIRIHQKIQYSRPAGYSPEVALSHQVETPAVVLAIGGRIDGVFENAAVPVIDEIKTTRRNPEDCLREENPLHWGQAKVYAFLYASGVDHRRRCSADLRAAGHRQVQEERRYSRGRVAGV
jgi:DNA excision repair protein ERCC-2